jgi:hypothetical protein
MPKLDSDDDPITKPPSLPPTVGLFELPTSEAGGTNEWFVTFGMFRDDGKPPTLLDMIAVLAEQCRFMEVGQ